MRFIKKIIPFCLLAVFIYIIWPGSSDRKSHSEDNPGVADNKSESKLKSTLNERPPLQQADFKPQTVERPEADQKKTPRKVTNPAALSFERNIDRSVKEGYGEEELTSSVDVDQKPIQFQTTVASLKDPEQRQRISPLGKIPEFDANRYQSDVNYRKEYLSTAAVSRVYQSDDLSDISISRQSPYFQKVEQGRELSVTVKSAPNFPVSIASFDGGRFAESGLNFATVEADSSGTATFTFQASSGTIGETNLLVSSPAAKGQLKFKIHIQLPEVIHAQN